MSVRSAMVDKGEAPWSIWLAAGGLVVTAILAFLGPIPTPQGFDVGPVLRPQSLIATLVNAILTYGLLRMTPWAWRWAQIRSALAILFHLLALAMALTKGLAQGRETMLLASMDVLALQMASLALYGAVLILLRTRGARRAILGEAGP